MVMNRTVTVKLKDLPDGYDCYYQRRANGDVVTILRYHGQRVDMSLDSVRPAMEVAERLVASHQGKLNADALSEVVITDDGVSKDAQDWNDNQIGKKVNPE